MNQLCFTDTETTGLERDLHDPYEASWWLEDAPGPVTVTLPHTLRNAQPVALEIGRYHERGFTPGYYNRDRWENVERMAHDLEGVTLVGSNPGFDAGMLSKLVGTPWSHRMVNVAEGAMWILGWDRPKGLAAVRDHLVGLGYEIPGPDHTAEGDVRTTRAVYYALREMQTVGRR